MPMVTSQNYCHLPWERWGSQGCGFQLETRIIPPNCKTKEELAQRITTKTHILRRPVCKISMLLAANEVPGERNSNDETTFFERL